MNIVHVADFGMSYNGIVKVVSTFQYEQSKLGNNVAVILIRRNAIINSNLKYRYLNSLFSFWYFIKNKNPDIVIFHSLYKIQYVGYSLILLMMNIPYLIEFHGGSSFYNMRKNHWSKKLANLLYFNFFVDRSAGLIYLNEQEWKDSIFKDRKVNKVIIPNGVYLPDGIVELKSNKQKKKIEIVFLSRIDIHHKGIDLLLEAISILHSSGYSNFMHFSFYGDAKNADEFYKLCLPYSDMVEYKGSVFGDQKKKVFQEADLFILTSRYEGMPIAILEALSYACPCIVTKETNMAELIEKNSAGWVTALNPKEIARTIENAYNDYIVASHSYQQNAYKAVKDFDWSEIVKNSIDKYIDLIKKIDDEKNAKANI